MQFKLSSKQVPGLLLPIDAISKLLPCWQSRDTTGLNISVYILPITIILTFKRFMSWFGHKSMEVGSPHTERENKKQVVLHKGLVCTKVLDHCAPWSDLSYIIFLGLNFSTHRMNDIKGLMSGPLQRSGPQIPGLIEYLNLDCLSTAATDPVYLGPFCYL